MDSTHMFSDDEDKKCRTALAAWNGFNEMGRDRDLVLPPSHSFSSLEWIQPEGGQVCVMKRVAQL